MACGGCQQRRAALQGMLQQQNQQKALQQRAQQTVHRLAVVGQHMMRDAGRVVRSALPAQKKR